MGCSGAEPSVTTLGEGELSLLGAGEKSFPSSFQDSEVCQAYQRLYLPCQFKVLSGLACVLCSLLGFPLKQIISFLLTESLRLAHQAVHFIGYCTGII